MLLLYEFYPVTIICMLIYTLRPYSTWDLHWQKKHNYTPSVYILTRFSSPHPSSGVYPASPMSISSSSSAPPLNASPIFAANLDCTWNKISEKLNEAVSPDSRGGGFLSCRRFKRNLHKRTWGFSGRGGVVVKWVSGLWVVRKGEGLLDMLRTELWIGRPFFTGFSFLNYKRGGWNDGRTLSDGNVINWVMFNTSMTL